MKFVVNSVSKFSGRLGYFSKSENGKQYNTPLLIQTTKGGSVPYLSKEVFNYVTKDEQILQICLTSTYHMEEAVVACKKNISFFVGNDSFPSFLSIKDPCEIAPSGFHEKDILPMFTRKGKLSLTAERYMKLVENFKPDMYHILCDSDTNFNSPKKRVAKSVDRTEQFFKSCIEIHRGSKTIQNSFLFAPIVGGYIKEERLKCIKFLSYFDEINGYMIDGLHNYGIEALKLNEDSVKDIVSYCIEHIDCDSKPRMTLGAYNPLIVLQLIILGIDVFDTSFVYLTASNCKALIFSFNLAEKIENKLFTIDLINEKYKDDILPILQNCECLTCKKHTKAYVHHLTMTNELLGPILLMIHNMHHYLRYFEAIRELIRKDELPKLLEHLRNQLSDTDEFSTINNNNVSNSNENKRKYGFTD